MSEIKVNSIKGVAASVAALTINNTDGTCAANITSINGGQLGSKRININGAMTVSQRGTVTGITNNASAYGGPDRYKTTVVNHGTYTTSQEADAPDGFVNSLKINTTSAASSPASNARLYLQHKIEKTDLIQLKKGTSGALQITAQFFVKSDKTGTYILEIFDNVNNRHVSATYAISSANTWEQKTITFPADTGGNAFTAGNTTGLEFNWWLAAGSAYTSGSLATTWSGNDDTKRVVGITANVGDSGYWQITGVQIEIGDTASSFESRSYAQELASCQRYYQEVRGCANTGATGTSIRFNCPLMCEMRAEPSVGKGGSGNINVGDMVSQSSNSSATPTSDGYSGDRLMMSVNVAEFSGLTQYRQYCHELTGSHLGLISCSAEL